MSQLKLSGDASGTGIVTVAAPNTNSTYTVTLPAAAGTIVTGAAGSDTQVQFNDSGSFGGDAGLTYNKTTNTLSTDAYVASAGTASAPSITTTGDTNTGLFFPAADTAAITTGGSERMRITSAGNVGIGTSAAPGVNGSGLAIYASDYPRLTLRNSTTGDTNADGLQINMVGNDVTYNLIETGYQRWTTNGTERMRLDSAGNVGIGAAPSTWSLGTAIQVGTANDASILGYNNSIYLTANHYFNSGWKYAATAAAARYEMNSGIHYWFSSPSGTAGNAITQTQVLQLERDKTLALQGATSQSGTGITFPATQSASSDANTLDDYEEGTWTPNQGSGLTVVGTFSSNGAYIKIGRQVTVYAQLTGSTSVAVSGADAIMFTNLPFAVANRSVGGAVKTTHDAGIFTSSSSTTVYGCGALAASTYIFFSLTYITS